MGTNIVEKGENAGYPAFSLFSAMFSKGLLKIIIVKNQHHVSIHFRLFTSQEPQSVPVSILPRNLWSCAVVLVTCYESLMHSMAIVQQGNAPFSLGIALKWNTSHIRALGRIPATSAYRMAILGRKFQPVMCTVLISKWNMNVNLVSVKWCFKVYFFHCC